MTDTEKAAWAAIYAAIWTSYHQRGGLSREQIRQIATEEADHALGLIQRA